jgi:hypothetical protein
MPESSRLYTDPVPAVKPESKSWLADLQSTAKPADDDLDRLKDEIRNRLPDLPPPVGMLREEWQPIVDMFEVLKDDIPGPLRGGLLIAVHMQLTQVMERQPSANWFRKARIENGGRKPRKPPKSATSRRRAGGAA